MSNRQASKIRDLKSENEEALVVIQAQALQIGAALFVLRGLNQIIANGGTAIDLVNWWNNHGSEVLKQLEAINAPPPKLEDSELRDALAYWGEQIRERDARAQADDSGN